MGGTAKELQDHAAKTQDTLVDAVENAEVAEIKRAVFRALTRLRAATIKEFDTIARLETQAIDAYNDAHHYRTFDILSINPVLICVLLILHAQVLRIRSPIFMRTRLLWRPTSSNPSTEKSCDQTQQSLGRCISGTSVYLFNSTTFWIRAGGCHCAKKYLCLLGWCPPRSFVYGPLIFFGNLVAQSALCCRTSDLRS